MRKHPKKQPAPSLAFLCTGPKPSGQRMELGDRVTLYNGLVLTLVYAENRVPIFRAHADGGTWHQMWTSHKDRPSLYIRVGDWPRGPRVIFDTDEAIERALTAQNIAETLLNLDEYAPLDTECAQQPGEVA